MAPSFDLRGDQIRILKTPADFYETLKVMTARSTKIMGERAPKKDSREAD